MSLALRINHVHGDWPAAVPIAPERVLVGEPVASTLLLDDVDGYQLGLWQVTPGEFTTQHFGYLEYITVLSGAGRLIDDEGTITELAPGITVLMRPGWCGRWIVDETLTKAFTVITR